MVVWYLNSLIECMTMYQRSCFYRLWLWGCSKNLGKSRNGIHIRVRRFPERENNLILIEVQENNLNQKNRIDSCKIKEN